MAVLAFDISQRAKPISMAFMSLLSDLWFFACLPVDEECGRDVECFEGVEDLLGAGLGAVVKGEVDGGGVLQLDLASLLHGEVAVHHLRPVTLASSYKKNNN